MAHHQTDLESGGGFSPATFFVSSRPAKTTLSQRGNKKERKNHESINSSKTNNSNISHSPCARLLFVFTTNASSTRRSTYTESRRSEPGWVLTQFHDSRRVQRA